MMIMVVVVVMMKIVIMAMIIMMIVNTRSLCWQMWGMAGGAVCCIVGVGAVDWCAIQCPVLLLQVIVMQQSLSCSSGSVWLQGRLGLGTLL